MEINYRDYVHPSCDDAYFSRLSVVNPNNMKKPTTFSFCYHLKFEIDKIVNQSEYFSNEIVRNSVLSNIVNRNVQGNPDMKRKIIRDLYIYSYMKSYNMCVTLQQTRNEYSGNPGANSTLFRGHAELYRIFYDTFILTINPSDSKFNSSLYKTISITDEDIASFKDSEFYVKYNTSTIKFFFINYELERLFDALKRDAQQYISIVECSERLTIDPKKSPLGNMCLYSQEGKDEKELLIINNKSALTDFDSKFWNIANNIYFESCNAGFQRCFMTSYIFTSVDDLDESCIFSQIQSITGLNCGKQFTDYGSNNSPTDGTPNTPVLPRDGKPFNPSSTGNRSTKNVSPTVSKGSNKVLNGTVKTVANVIKQGGSAALSAVKTLVNDPDIKEVLSTAILNKLEESTNNRQLLALTPVGKKKTTTKVGHPWMLYNKVTETEEELVSK